MKQRSFKQYFITGLLVWLPWHHGLVLM